MLTLKLKLNFLAKKSLFIGPFSWILKKIGAIAIERSSRKNHQYVQSIAQRIKQSRQFILALSPEGTRKKIIKWKSGFYHIAKEANIPILPVALDYKNKIIVLGKLFMTTENQALDTLALQQFFLPYEPKHLNRAGHGIDSKH